MKLLPWAAAVAAVALSGCATSPETLSCLQPNRRVIVEISGTKERPAKAPAKAGAKPKRQRPQLAMLKAYVQGDAAWDYGEAVLKAGGKKELDKVLRTTEKGTRRDKRPMKLTSVVITGHTDVTEAADSRDLDEQRARAVRDYLVEKGVNPKTIFWQGKDAREPVPVTKFCEV